MADDRTARLAAIDQELAALDARLNRNHSAIMRADATVLLLAAAGIAYALAARQPVSYWHYAAVWAVVVLGAAGSLYQARMIRGYRAEIRDLRARAR